MKPKSERELSLYAKFHVQFQGYLFYDNVLKTLKSKFQLWHGHKYLCVMMLQRKKVVSRYTLIDREGWANGMRIKVKKKR